MINLDVTRLISNLTSHHVLCQVPDNCEDVSDSSCSFWSGGLKQDTVTGVVDFLTASGCKGKKLSITAGTEASHITVDFGKFPVKDLFFSFVLIKKLRIS